MADRFIGVRVPAELKERLQNEAADKGISLSAALRAYLENEWAAASMPFETGHDKANKAKVRKAVENGEGYEVKVVAGTALPKPRSSEEELRAEAMELVRTKGLSFRAALARVKRG